MNMEKEKEYQDVRRHHVESDDNKKKVFGLSIFHQV